MRRFAGTALGDIADFRLEHVPVPDPGPGAVRLRVEATGVGFVDGLIVAGRYQLKPALPYVPGGEIAGTVDAVGPGVATLAVGEPVVTWQLGGGAAEFVVLPADQVEARPPALAATETAALLLDGMTAHHALFDRGNLHRGETVLVLGATGGVGAAAVQLAVAAGAHVVAAVSSAAKAAAARTLGAHATIDYSDPDWRGALRGLVPGAGPDIVVDPVGGPAFELAFRSLAKGGRHLVLGFAAGEIGRLPANLPLLKNAALIGVDVRHLHDTAPDRARETRAAVMEMAAQGKLRARIAGRYPLDQAAAAFVALGRRERIGKVLITP